MLEDLIRLKGWIATCKKILRKNINDNVLKNCGMVYNCL